MAETKAIKKKFSDLTAEQKQQYLEGLRYEEFKKVFEPYAKTKPRVTKHYRIELKRGVFEEAFGDSESLSDAKILFKYDCYDKYADKHLFVYEDVERDEDGNLVRDASGNVKVVKKETYKVSPDTLVGVKEDGTPSKYVELAALKEKVSKAN